MPPLSPRKPPDPHINIASIAEPISAPDTPDPKTRAEEHDLEAREHEAYITGLLQDIAERKKFAGRIFCMLSLWLVGIFVLLLAQGIGYPRGWFSLSDSVMLAAIGGTTVNVIGIFVFVARYLFPRRPMHRNPSVA